MISTCFRITKGLSFLAITLVATLAFVPTLRSDPSNAIENAGFEETTYWEPYYSTNQGSFAAIRDSTVKKKDDYSGLTRTNDPKAEYCAGYLYQSLDVEVLELDTFCYYVRKADPAANGYCFAQVQILLTQGYVLHYYHPLGSQFPMPSDTGTHKYINVGSLKPTGLFIQVSRDLFADLVDKFGVSIADQSVTGVRLWSQGSKDLETGEKYGQRINWDEIYMTKQSYILKEDFDYSFLVVRNDESSLPCKEIDENTCHTVWWNVTVYVAGYQQARGSPYYFERHKIIVWQGQFNGVCQPIETCEDFRFTINNYTCYGLDSNQQIVYKTTFGPDSSENIGYYNTTCFAEENVSSIYTYANVTIRDTQYNEDPPDPCAPDKYWNQEVTISIQSGPQ